MIDGHQRLWIERYEQKIFALVLYLMGGSRDAVYDIAASACADALKASSPLEREDAFLVRLVRTAIEKSGDLKEADSPDDDSDLRDFPPEKRASLRMIKTALRALPFDTRALVLLRDQLHLPYRDIASVLSSSEKDVRIEITQARIRLRKEVENILSHGG